MKSVTLKSISEEEKFDGAIYGCVDYDTKMYINIERLWDDTTSEEEFITYYSKIMLHETIHYIIEEIYGELFLEKEEEIVDKISGTEELSTPKKLMQVFNID